MKILSIATPSLPTFAGIAQPNAKGSYQGLRLPVAVLAVVPEGKGGDTRVVPLVYQNGEFLIASDDPGFLGLETMMTPNQAPIDWGRRAQEYAANKKKQEATPAAPPAPPAPATGSSAGDPNAGKTTTTSGKGSQQ